ncbi:MAG: penicillin-binding protein [Cytophagia bacterium]|nr:MAG: penicillin-binding protein [Runella sp.]TAG19344.1 MAG: penicillin-binding protein [Cytophagales bacterium]TAG38608.1 MAG: penicillin-binding protein [Cytophagia bacterium]TAG80258.1 MAG: penicillin-binding protein [Cytophagales bacterium]
MNPFFKTIQTFIKSVGMLLTRSRQWVAHQLFNLLVAAFGQARMATWAAAYQGYKNRFQQAYFARIDVHSPYYKPVVRVWKALIYSVLAFVFYIFCVETNFLWLSGSMPSIEELQNPKVAQSSEIYSTDGQLIGKFYTENRTPVDFDSLSPFLTQALIATEDIRFYEHAGIDSRALFGVAVGLVKGGGERGGGSTITQQLAKKLFRTRRKAARGLLGKIPLVRTLIYKTKEWLTSIKLERNFSKEEILTMYFNTVDYGSNTYGIKTAARYYFDKSPINLTLPEAAVLVGLQKATTTYNPENNPEKSLTRRNTVLSQMAKYGFVSQKTADSASQTPLKTRITPERFNDENDEYAIYQYYNGAAKEFLKKWGEENGYDASTDGLKIYTSVDSRMQKHAVAAVGERMKILQQTFESHWLNQNPWRDEKGVEIIDFLKDVAKRTDRYKQLAKRFPNTPDSIWVYMSRKDTMTVYDWKTGREKRVVMSSMDSLNYYKRILRAGLMAMDPYTGHVKAWVGGLNYKFFKYDAVQQGKRQPGSTFKPFVYCAAIDSSAFNMGPCDKLKDVPFQKEYEEGGEKKIWRPKNSTGGFSYQELTLRRALARSINSITAQLTEKIGSKSVVKYAQKLGITSPLQGVPSIGLGPFDVSLYDMVTAYSVFPNQGKHTDPILVTRIEDANGTVLEEFAPQSKQVISEESAFLMVHMLKGGIEEPGGTSQNMWTFGSLFKQGFEMGGKTGTTSNNSDGWFMGVTKDLVVGGWVGGDDRSIHFRSTNLGEGSKTALPLVGRFLEKVYDDPNCGYRRGGFPKPTVVILKSYRDCAPSYPVERRDTTNANNDSLQFLPPSSEAPAFEENETPPDTTNSR